MTNQVYLCAINNILSGSCNQDCSFCAQSVKYHANIDRYYFKPIEQIIFEAKKAKEVGALGYCLVTSGLGLDDKKTEFIAKTAKAIKQEINDIHLIACNGIASMEQLRYLKESGIDSYNHNLESSQNYYKKICSTHSWDERYQTCLNAKSVGLSLCSGGIFGMGEEIEDRIDFIKSIKSLNPDAVPINFYLPNDALPLKSSNLTKNEAIKIIEDVKNSLPEETIIMIAGGRELIFGKNLKEMFEAGANSMVIGNYLTTEGELPDFDKQILGELNLEIATTCPN
ncbi:MAG: biotin synthase [Sulfurovaceae bacterium]|nr:biotin synthase [Sulfurovaceae bacterium]MDD5548834.1 biotin synthase [Sulfurovaceae bacterium]